MVLEGKILKFSLDFIMNLQKILETINQIYYYYVYTNISWFIDLKFQKNLLKCCIFKDTDLYNLMSVFSFQLIPIMVVVLVYGVLSQKYFILFGLIPWAIIGAITVFLTAEYYKKSEVFSSGIQNKKFSPDKPHHGILFVQYEEREKQFFIADTVDLLIKIFDESQPYKVYPIKSEDDFKQAYNNPNIRWLWILAHGEKRHITLVENKEVKFIEYSNYSKQSNLVFIAQLHCNPGPGRSLVEINELTPGYDINHVRLPYQNRCYIMRKAKEFVEQRYEWKNDAKEYSSLITGHIGNNR